MDTPVFNAQTGTGRIGKGLQLARSHGGVNQFTSHHLRAGFDQAGVGVPQGALNHGFFQKREPGLGLCGSNHFHPVAKSLA